LEAGHVTAEGRPAGEAGGAEWQRGYDLEFRLPITFDEAAFGAEKTITIPRYEACQACGGAARRPAQRPSGARRAAAAARSALQAVSSM